MKRRSRLRPLWGWSWIVTIPVTIAWSLWCIDTWRHWRHFGVTYDAGALSPSLHATGEERWRLMRRAALMPFGPRLTGIEAELQLPNIQLFVAGRDRARLDADLPASGFDWIDGELIHPDGRKPVRVRYRGDLLLHWAGAKKSWRIKTANDELFAGMRAFNLIAPKFPAQVNNHLSYRLASMLGLMAPRSELVNVFLNGRNQGLHQFTEQLDESTLRRHGRMPGDLYAGDLIGRGRMRGAGDRLFESAAQWTKIAANNHYDVDSLAPLEALLRLLDSVPGQDTHAELSRLLDIDAWGRFSAFELLTQSRQFDEHHNWRLFWDPWKLKFEPVVWDPAGWSPAAQAQGIALEIVTSQLHQWLLQNGEFLAARRSALERFFADGSASRFDATCELAFAAARRALACDPLIRPGDPAAIAAAMAACRTFQREVFTAIATAHTGDRDRIRWQRQVGGGARVEVDAHAGPQQLQLHYRDALATTPTVHVDGTDVSATVAVAAQRLTLAIALPAERRATGSGWLPTPTTYDLTLQGIDPANELLTIQGQPPTVALLQQQPLQLFRAVTARPHPTVTILRGDVHVTETTEYRDEVIIEPGTTIRVAPGASMFFRNRVTALGTAERPIRFATESRDALPWGTLALTGEACSGSRLRWCDVRGGSGQKTPLAEFCSMFSVHDCRRIEIEHCRFGEGHRFDDVVHVLYAEAVFDHVTIEGALSDALDCDLSTVVVRHCTFRASGNDGIDLMTSDAVVHDCRFEQNGDKGLSIGEGSRLVAVRNTFRGCGIALEAKDGSIAHVVNSDLSGCKKPLSAYKKNWRYDAGGQVTIHKSIVSGNGTGPTSDRWSRAVLADCRLEDAIAAEYEQAYDDGTTKRMRNTVMAIDADPGVGPRNVAPLGFPAELRPIEALAAEVWASIRADHRGVPDAD